MGCIVGKFRDYCRGRNGQLRYVIMWPTPAGEETIYGDEAEEDLVFLSPPMKAR
jgi:hypothetical protein